MSRHFAIIIFLATASLFASFRLQAETHASRTVEALEPYLIDQKHPLKKRLDRFFSSSRVIKDVHSLKKAGFENCTIRKWTNLVVSKHPRFPGYVFKIYLDSTPPHRKKPEHYFWILRIQGAGKIRSYVSQNGLGHLFKVPKKWIYQLPKKPKLAPGSYPKYYILVEEDMDLLSDADNEAVWRSKRVDRDFLLSFYTLVTRLGLADCAKPANASFSKDGRVAFIDTQSWGKSAVNYAKLTPFLSDEMRNYWLELTNH